MAARRFGDWAAISFFMSIESSDILKKYSVTTGSAGNSVAQANPNASLGKYISTTQWAGGVLHDLFDAVTGRENAAGRVEYRCIFIHNAHATLTWTDVLVWLSDVVADGAEIAIGLDPAGVVAIGASSAQASTIAGETSAPAGVTFSAPTDEDSGLAVADIAPGFCQAIWIRRTATDSDPINSDGATLNFSGDTAA